jgi:hypothetical protein
MGLLGAIQKWSEVLSMGFLKRLLGFEKTPEPGCDRCGRRYKGKGASYSGGVGMFMVDAGNSASQQIAFKCVRCGRVYCQRCANYESKMVGSSVVTADFELCCNCGSTNFQPLPVEYL